MSYNRKCVDCIYAEKFSYDIDELEKQLVEAQTKLDDTADSQWLYRALEIKELINSYNNKVRCFRYPTDVIKMNDEWCGEYERKPK